MTIRNFFLAMRDQLPWSRLARNVVTGRIRGLFHERSHMTEGGKPKVTYNSKASALRAAASMEKKKGVEFTTYKCLYCDGHHVAKRKPR